MQVTPVVHYSPLPLPHLSYYHPFLVTSSSSSSSSSSPPSPSPSTAVVPASLALAWCRDVLGAVDHCVRHGVYFRWIALEQIGDHSYTHITIHHSPYCARSIRRPT